MKVLADHNIAHLHDYFNPAVLGTPTEVIAMSGRDITADILEHHQPDAVLIRSVTAVNQDLLAGNRSVKFVGSATIGTDHVQQALLAQRGIAFANASGCSKHSVAQYVLTAILTLRPEYWQTPIKLGIIGLGNIGSTLATYAQDLGWQVLGHDPFLPASASNNATFKQIIEQSEVISLHVPLTTPADSPHPTQHMIDASVLQNMPSDTMLINSARGAVIHQQDLTQDLEVTARQVVLDVFEHEPTVPASLIRSLAIATPHIAGYTLEGKLRGTQMIFDAFRTCFHSRLNITHSPTLSTLLPTNPWQWQALKAQPKQLPKFYDIIADDALLRDAIDPKSQQVPPQTFDALRKNYPLRREWLADF